MLRSSSKIKMFGALVSLASLPVLSVSSAFAATTTGNSNFRVNVGDALTVSVTTPDTWATGDVDQFLRNHIVVSATTNSAGGLTASMYTKTSNTNLTNTRRSTYTIPTLSTTVTSKENFPTNYWGYSITDTENALDTDTNVLYNPLRGPSNPITLLDESEPGGPYTQDVFFGAKADTTVAAGTYANTVVISVVTGVVDNDETIPDPENPGQDIPNPDYNPMPPVNPPTNNPTPNTPTYNPTTNTTTYTTVTPNDDNTTTTTTEVSSGNTVNQYADPHGVSTRKISSTEGGGNALATGLAITSAVTGATGFIFFIVGKRRKDEDEEEENAGGEQPPVQQ